MAGTSASKLLSGHDVHMGVSQSLYVALCILELVTVIVLLSRWSTLGVWVALGLAIIGCWHAFVARPEFCGCVGSWLRTDWRVELLLASILGILSVLSFPDTNPHRDP